MPEHHDTHHDTGRDEPRGEDRARRELADRIGRYLDGKATDADITSLNTSLAEDAAARDLYVSMAMQAGLLSELAKSDEHAGSPVDADETTDGVIARVGVSPSWLRYAAAAAVLIVAGLAMVMMTTQRDGVTRPHASADRDDRPVATLTELRDATWAEGSGAALIDLGSALEPGTLRLESGTAELMMASTATVTLIGPTEFEMLSDMRVRLDRGRLLAHVPAAAHGFVIETPTAIVTDRGTYFSVSVDGAGVTEVNVYEGRVDAQRTAGGPVTAVIAGRAARVSDDTRTIASGPIEPSAALRSMFDVSTPNVDGGFESGVFFASGGPREGHRWTGDRATIVEATSRVMPYDGVRMLRIDATTSNGASAEHGSCELYRFVDLSKHREAIESGRLIAAATAHFNRIDAGPDTDTAFALSLWACRKSELSAERFVAESIASLESDGDVTTWEALSTALRLPADADCLIIRITAVENVRRDPGSPEFDGHFIDGVTLKLLTERREPGAAP